MPNNLAKEARLQSCTLLPSRNPITYPRLHLKPTLRALKHFRIGNIRPRMPCVTLDHRCELLLLGLSTHQLLLLLSLSHSSTPSPISTTSTNPQLEVLSLPDLLLTYRWLNDTYKYDSVPIRSTILRRCPLTVVTILEMATCMAVHTGIPMPMLMLMPVVMGTLPISPTHGR